jgi:hypothetical protein
MGTDDLQEKDSSKADLELNFAYVKTVKGELHDMSPPYPTM